MDVALRRENDAALVAALGGPFAERTAAEWESLLGAVDVACVEVAAGPVEANFMDEGGPGQSMGLVTEAWHSILDDHARLSPHVSMSRSAGVAGGGCLVGEHTDSIMLELGHSEKTISDLRFAGVIGG